MTDKRAELEGGLGRLIHRYKTWRRRRRLEKGYLRIAQAELDKTYGFSPTVRRLEMMEEDGYIEIDGEELRWLWP